MDDLKTGLEGLFQTFIDLTSKLVLPDWNDVVTLLLPLALLLGLVAPILTILVLYWAYQTAKRPRFRVRPVETAPVAVSRDEAGEPVVPANVPYCSRDGLLYPARTAKCSACGDELTVRCPVDGTLRTTRLETCGACGTRYVLGAADTALTVRRVGGPPEGGAAVA